MRINVKLTSNNNNNYYYYSPTKDYRLNNEKKLKLKAPGLEPGLLH